MATFSQILHHNVEHPVQPWEPGERAETEKKTDINIQISVSV